MLIIGITGGTGSGKTTVVQQIVDGLPKEEVCVISQDSYYHDTSHLSFEERLEINFDEPKSIDFDLLVDHLNKLKQGQAIEQPIYSFEQHNRTGETRTMQPKKVMVVEGILLFSHPELRELCDIKLFIDADSDERLIRRLKRDTVERGRETAEILTWYQNRLKPMHDKHIEPTKVFADFVIPNNSYNTVAVGVIRQLIQQKLT